MRQKRTKVLILTRMSVMDVGLVVLARMLNRRVICLNLGKRASCICRVLSVEILDTDVLPEVQLDRRSYDEAMTKFSERVTRWMREIESTAVLGACERPLDGYSTGVLRVSLLQHAARYARGVYRSSVWLGAEQPAGAVIRCDNRFEQLVFDSCLGLGSGVRVVRRHLTMFSQVAALSRRLIDSAGSRWPQMISTWRPTTPVVESADPHDAQLGARVLLFLNHGLDYGLLYSYDFLLDDKPDTPASWVNAVVVSRDGGRLSNGVVSFPWPSAGLGLASQLRIRNPFSMRTTIPAPAVRVLRESIARALKIQASIQRSYPQLEVAIYAFDAQVPAEYTLAFEFAGIRTIAIHERPATAVTASVPMAVETLLTASEYFSHRVLSRGVHAVRRAQPIGMWRTDLLSVKVTPPAVTQRQRVLVLPFVLTEAVESGWPFATTRVSVTEFLIDIACVAATRPDADFILRAKATNWLTREAFTAFFDAVDALPNLTISDDYSSMDVSYKLLAGTNLVIGKHTSLIDEALAANIPCLVHDYSSNTKNYARYVLDYIPEFAWTESRRELVTKVSEVLDDHGERFRAQWQPLRDRVFGTGPDGQVRQRYSAAVDGILTR